MIVISSFVGVIAGILAFGSVVQGFRKLVLPYLYLPKLKKPDQPQIVLSAQHMNSPDIPPLQGKTILTTGIVISHFDSLERSVTIHGFPFSIGGFIECQLADDEHTPVETLDLISVIGTATSNIIREDATGRLHLNGCHIRRPSLSNRIRHWLINGPIGGPIREWWYFGRI
jgi:hypothetical protein